MPELFTHNSNYIFNLFGVFGAELQSIKKDFQCIHWCVFCNMEFIVFVYLCLWKPGHCVFTFQCQLIKFKYKLFAYFWSFQLKSLSLSLFSPLSFGLWSNKEICLGAKYFPLRVFKHLGSLLLFLSVSHSKFLSFCLCLLWSVM